MYKVLYTAKCYSRVVVVVLLRKSLNMSVSGEHVVFCARRRSLESVRIIYNTNSRIRNTAARVRRSTLARAFGLQLYLFVTFRNVRATKFAYPS